MPTTPSRCRPAGQRARLITLLALAAAFLLVPAGQAAAEHGEPHLKLTIVGIDGAGGEVVSPDNQGHFGVGTPPIECTLPEGTGAEQEGVCENEMELGQPELWGVSLSAFGGPNSEHVDWEVKSGIPFGGGGCGTEPPGNFCLLFSTDAEEDGEVTVVLGCREGKECPGVPLTLKKTGTGKSS